MLDQTCFYRSYCPVLKVSFPDFSLQSFEILAWHLVYVNSFWPNTDEVLVSSSLAYFYRTLSIANLKFGNWKRLHLKKETVTVDTNIWYKGTKKHNLWKHSDSKNKDHEADIIKMLEFLVDNIFRGFCWSLPADSGHCNGYELCPYSYEADFIQSLHSTGKKQRLGSISLTGTSMMNCP